MSLWSRLRLRHPLYPGLTTVPAVEATGRCQALSGTMEDLRRAGASGVRPLRAVFVERRASDPFLTPAERDELWECFGVPALAVLLDGQGRVVGYECEAHQGLHVARRLLPGPHLRLERGPCNCGRPGLRLVAAAPSVAAAGVNAAGSTLSDLPAR